MPDELEQKIVDLQNQINDLKLNLFKNEFSNTTIITKEVSQLTNGYQSANFVTGSTGWRFDALGNLEANIGNFRGDITGASGTFSGTITAILGSIGGFNIGSDYLRDVANTFGLASTVAVGDDVRFWAGDTFVNRATAPFRVTEAGAVTGSNLTITGGSVATSVLNGLIPQANLNLADRGWSQTSVFSVTDADTVAWAAGTFTSADGTAYSIGAGNTGNMSAKTYIYLDIAVSTTAYQVTTTSTTAVGVGKVLVAIAQNATTEATFQVVNGQGGQNIDASSIVAGSITANEIAASTITAGKLSVTSLASIVADLGAITAGSITLDTSGYIRGGQTDYNTGTGFFLGYSGAAYKFSIGSTTQFLTWDGANLTMTGGINKLVGTILYASADTARAHTDSIYTLKKAITVYTPGAYTVKFTLWSQNANPTAYGQIYKNGSAVGTERTNSNGTPTEFSENISGIVSGDVIQLYIKLGGSCTGVACSNFRLYVSQYDSYTITTD